MDCNHSVLSTDALLVLQLSAQLIGGLPCAQYADVNGDGRIDTLDALLILQFAAGLIDGFP